ncbi:signal-induced proliferation-associated 1-like protein 1 isoform X2 [Paramacrobiotus metropolitanus]|uniref:signal-induced proliferation-associated 1-like protein 1 isoform X2 n=1 Tax=Paramacrobiotus metropolitanus TaxID=2943436 RepID=UPI00244606DE|nr:signal-induced proliferation-associated 1-like protein 1 isoform X2 [Paramacrobiotus metropolitanus]
MSASVDAGFYYQSMQNTAAMSGIPIGQSIPTGYGGGLAPPPYKEALARSPKSPRHLTAVVRPVYDDRSARAVTVTGGRYKVADAEIIANPMARRYHHHRSVSSLDVSMEEDDTPKPTLLKEFSGSASSIDFSKTIGGNIRMILDQLKHGKPITSNSSSNSLASLQNSDGSGSGILCASKRAKNGKDKPKKSSIRSRSSIFRKMRGGSQSEVSSGLIEPEPASTTSVSDGERIRRRIFAYYDTQSLFTKFGRTDEMQMALSRKLVTGASAAHLTTRCVLPSAENSSDSHPGIEADEGDGKSNALVTSCPYFRNEVAAENSSQSESPVSTYSGITIRRPPGRRIYPTAFRPYCGSLVLEDDNPSAKIKCVQLSQPRFEFIDNGAFYYRKYFHGEEHWNYFGIDETFGPVAVSLKKEKPSGANSRTLYRTIVRTSDLAVLRGSVLENSLARLNKDGVKPKDVLECVAPEIQTSSLRLGTADLKTEELLLKLDEQTVPKHYKVGIMYCKAGQCTEEEMYNNETAGPAFDEFLDLLGQRIRLKSFDKYRAQLDNKSDSTGLYSLYTTFQDYEIMFHVSTMLPFTPSNKQQLLRKRHIGNDIITIVFQEPGALPFSPKTIRSNFQHVFIVVRVENPNTEYTRYRVSVSRSRDVPQFGPPLPASGVFAKGSEFVDFILTKVINAENAAHKSDKFMALAIRTRQEYLKELANNHSTHSGIDMGLGKLSMFSLSHKKKDKPIMNFLPDATLRGALAWSVQARESDLSVPLSARLTLGISANYVVLMDPTSGMVMKIVPNSNIMAWKSQEESLTVYYHVGENMQILCDSADDWREIIQRLKVVTSGCEVIELPLSRNAHGHLGFHTQFNGIITDVDPHSNAAAAGLRKGCRLLEICGRSVISLDHNTMTDLLRRTNPVSVAVLPPLDSGLPRRGCSRPACMKPPEHILSANYDNLSDPLTMPEQMPSQATTVHPVASRSTSGVLDGHIAFYLKSESPVVAPARAVPVPPFDYDSETQPSLDDLEAESRWWVLQMSEATARLDDMLTQAPPAVAPVWERASLPREPLRSYGELSNKESLDLHPARPFERKLSPNTGLPLFDSGTDTMSSTTSKSSTRSQKENNGVGQSLSPSARRQFRHHKTDPGFRPPPTVQSPPSRTAIRNSPNKSSKKGARPVGNFQEDLLRLINPDLIDTDRMTFGDPIPSYVDGIRRASDETSHRRSQPVDDLPLPTSKSLEALPIPLHAQPLDWRTLVSTAERAAKNANDVPYPHVSSESSSTSPDMLTSAPKPSPPPLRPRSSSRRHLSRPVSGEFQPDRFMSDARIRELESTVTKLIQDLNKTNASGMPIPLLDERHYEGFTSVFCRKERIG